MWTIPRLVEFVAVEELLFFELRQNQDSPAVHGLAVLIRNANRRKATMGGLITQNRQRKLGNIVRTIRAPAGFASDVDKRARHDQANGDDQARIGKRLGT